MYVASIFNLLAIGSLLLWRESVADDVVAKILSNESLGPRDYTDGVRREGFEKSNSQEVGNVTRIVDSSDNATLEKNSDVNSNVSYAEVVAYIEVPGLGEYAMHENELPWEKAQEVCIKEGANLAVIRTYFEATIIDALINQSPPQFHGGYVFWVGARQLMMKGGGDLDRIWKTILWEDMTIPIPTRKEETLAAQIVFGPDTSAHEQCGILSSQSGLLSAPCAYPAAFICKRELKKQMD